MVNNGERVSSQELFNRAKEIFPGGVNSPVRAFRSVGGEPFFVARGEGPYLFDVEGNRYIDCVLSWGPLVMGHAHPVVSAAIALSLGLKVHRHRVKSSPAVLTQISSKRSAT